MFGGIRGRGWGGEGGWRLCNTNNHLSPGFCVNVVTNVFQLTWSVFVRSNTKAGKTSEPPRRTSGAWNVLVCSAVWNHVLLVACFLFFLFLVNSASPASWRLSCKRPASLGFPMSCTFTSRSRYLIFQVFLCSHTPEYLIMYSADVFLFVLFGLWKHLISPNWSWRCKNHTTYMREILRFVRWFLVQSFVGTELKIHRI